MTRIYLNPFCCRLLLFVCVLVSSACLCLSWMRTKMLRINLNLKHPFYCRLLFVCLLVSSVCLCLS